MSTFEVLVRTVEAVSNHPNADRLSIVKVLGFEAISAKNEDGTHRYAAGDPIIYVPEASLIPEPLLRQYGFYDETKQKGILAGKNGDRVKAIRLRGIISQGLIWPLHENADMVPGAFADERHPFLEALNGDQRLVVHVGDNVADFFGITKYEPPVPVGMGGEVAAVYAFALDYDIENAQNFPGFLDHDEVEATEKLHGTNCRIAYRPEVNHEEMFGQRGSVGISSKGLGQKGLVFKNNEANQNNLYVRVLRDLGLIERIEAMGVQLGKSIDLFGEIFGQGVQDLTYGQSKPVLRAFDIAIGGEFMSTDEKIKLFAALGVERVPVLYRGPWDRDVLVEHRDGKTLVGGENIREGIVVTAVGPQAKRQVGNHRLRPFLKMVSPDYLVRGGNATEFN